MSNSKEWDIETLVIAILTASADLTGVSIDHYDSAETEPEVARISVQVAPKTPLLPARDTTIPAKVWQSTLTVYATRPLSDSVASFETWRNAIDAAIMPSGSYPAPVIASAVIAFPNGLDIDIASGGELQPPQSDNRTLTRTFRVKWIE